MKIFLSLLSILIINLSFYSQTMAQPVVIPGIGPVEEQELEEIENLGTGQPSGGKSALKRKVSKGKKASGKKTRQQIIRQVPQQTQQQAETQLVQRPQSLTKERVHPFIGRRGMALARLIKEAARKRDQLVPFSTSVEGERPLEVPTLRPYSVEQSGSSDARSVEEAKAALREDNQQQSRYARNYASSYTHGPTVEEATTVESSSRAFQRFFEEKEALRSERRGLQAEYALVNPGYRPNYTQSLTIQPTIEGGKGQRADLRARAQERSYLSSVYEERLGEQAEGGVAKGTLTSLGIAKEDQNIPKEGVRRGTAASEASFSSEREERFVNEGAEGAGRGDQRETARGEQQRRRARLAAEAKAVEQEQIRRRIDIDERTRERQRREREERETALAVRQREQRENTAARVVTGVVRRIGEIHRERRGREALEQQQAFQQTQAYYRAFFNGEAEVYDRLRRMDEDLSDLYEAHRETQEAVRRVEELRAQAANNTAVMQVAWAKVPRGQGLPLLPERFKGPERKEYDRVRAIEQATLAARDQAERDFTQKERLFRRLERERQADLDQRDREAEHLREIQLEKRGYEIQLLSEQGGGPQYVSQLFRDAEKIGVHPVAGTLGMVPLPAPAEERDRNYARWSNTLNQALRGNPDLGNIQQNKRIYEHLFRSSSFNVLAEHAYGDKPTLTPGQAKALIKGYMVVTGRNPHDPEGETWDEARYAAGEIMPHGLSRYSDVIARIRYCGEEERDREEDDHDYGGEAPFAC